VNSKLYSPYHWLSDLGFYRDKVSQIQHLKSRLYWTHTCGGENKLTFLEVFLALCISVWKIFFSLHVAETHYIRCLYLDSMLWVFRIRDDWGEKSVETLRNKRTAQHKRIMDMSCLSILQPTCFMFVSSQRIGLYFSRHADTQNFFTNFIFFCKDLPQPVL
jgi:hypothetical protein